MHPYSMVKLLFLVVLLIGCATVTDQKQYTPTSVSTATHVIVSTQSSITPGINTSAASTAIPILSSTPVPIPSVTYPPTIEPSATISLSADFPITDQCGTVYSNTSTIDTSFLAGIVTQDIDPQMSDDVIILNQNKEVAFRWNIPIGDWTATVSPDGQWLAATFYNNFDVDGNTTEVTVKVINPQTGQSYELQLASELIQLYSDALFEFNWLSNELLYISKLGGMAPRFKDGDMLEMHYFIWSPFDNKTSELTVPLPDYVYLQIEPTLDPLLEYVAYSCTSNLTCEQDALHIWDISSGTLAWSVQKGFALGFPDAGIWSRDGQMVAIFDVQHEQKTSVRIFSRNGFLLYETSVPGEVSSRSATWSPNNKLLAFTYWANYNENGHFVIFDITQGTVTRYCQGGSVSWSPASNMTIYDSFRDKGSYYLYHAYVLDINNGDVYLWRESEYPIEIYGWINPLSQ